MMPVRLEPAAPRSRVKHSTTEPLRSLYSVAFLLGLHCLPKYPLPIFCLMFNIPVNNFSVMSRQVFLVLTSTKKRIMCLVQGQNTVPSVRLEPATH